MPNMTANTLLSPSMKTIISRWLAGLSLGTTLVGCSHPLPPTEYRAYLADPEHGLVQRQEVNGAVATCAYRPTELLVLQDLAQVPAVTAAARDSLARAYAGKTYCALSFSRGGNEIENYLVNNPAAYQQVLSYLNTGIAADAYLGTPARDSVSALTSLYLRQYGTTGKSTLLLVFDTHRLTLKKGFHVSIQAQRLGLGVLHFPFTANSLAGLPALRID